MTGGAAGAGEERSQEQEVCAPPANSPAPEPVPSRSIAWLIERLFKCNVVLQSDEVYPTLPSLYFFEGLGQIPHPIQTITEGGVEMVRGMQIKLVCDHFGIDYYKMSKD